MLAMGWRWAGDGLAPTVPKCCTSPIVGPAASELRCELATRKSQKVGWRTQSMRCTMVYRDSSFQMEW
jgi:hypothetical protein